MRGHTVLAAAAMLVGAMAAPAAAQEVHVGALGGVGLTSLAFSPAPPVDFSKPTRPSVGGLLTVDVTETVEFETRVEWQRKAIRWQDPSGSQPFEATALVDYVSVPVLVRVAAPRGAARPYALAGAEVSFKAKATMAASASGSPVDLSAALDPAFDDSVRRTDVAIAVGGGIEFPAGGFSVFVDGLYTHGLRNLPTDDADTTYLDAKARTFRVSAGIRF